MADQFRVDMLLFRPAHAEIGDEAPGGIDIEYVVHIGRIEVRAPTRIVRERRFMGAGEPVPPPAAAAPPPPVAPAPAAAG